MDTNDSWTTSGTLGYLRRLEEYKDAITRLFPALPRHFVDTWSISNADALTVGLFLERYPRKVVVADIGTFVGVSAFHFASQPKVLRVTGIDPNPKISDEINDKSGVLGGGIDPEPLRDLRVLDVARAALAEFDAERQKIRLSVGVVGSSQVGIERGPLEGLERVEVPTPEPSDDASLVAFVDGLHTKEGVRADLEAIFEKNSRAVAILDDCRYTWGHFVQAGVVAFMEAARRGYDFRLVGDLAPGLATSKLGIVYPHADAAEAEQVLAGLGELFSERLDPLRLLRREEGLVDAINECNRELAQMRASRRYKAVDALAESVLRVPGIKKLARRKPPQ